MTQNCCPLARNWHGELPFIPINCRITMTANHSGLSFMVMVDIFVNEFGEPSHVHSDTFMSVQPKGNMWHFFSFSTITFYSLALAGSKFLRLLTKAKQTQCCFVRLPAPINMTGIRNLRRRWRS